MVTEFIIVFLLFYVWGALGVTLGYHRLLSHRSYSCVKFVEYFFVLGGYLSFEGSPIWWSTIHRAHHRYVDTPLDPHSPRYGLHNAHVGWLVQPGYSEHVHPESQAKDLLKDPIYRFLEQGGSWKKAHFIAFATGFAVRLVILAFFGWVPALASLLAGFAVLQIPLMLNVVCHIPRLGYKVYATADDSVNVWWVALLAMGEGWHNNHHASPGSAKTGMLPWEIDVSWLIIAALRKLKLVHWAKVSTHEDLVRYAQVSVEKQQRKQSEQLPTATSLELPKPLDVPVVTATPTMTAPIPITTLAGSFRGDRPRRKLRPAGRRELVEMDFARTIPVASKQ